MEISVHNPSYWDLFNTTNDGYSIKIPPYQRPYVWDTKKIGQLLTDWKEFLDTSSKGAPQYYYMGSLIIHIDHTNKILNIVDGQQRLTSMLMIDYAMNGENSALKVHEQKIKFTFNHHLSRANINANYKYIQKSLSEEVQTRKINNIFNNIRFSVIMTENEDDAFTFFDSQNNRGVQPAAVDVMKAVHLRAIQNDEELRKDCAIKWQNIQTTGRNIFRNSPEDYMDNLVDMALWRIRRWKGSCFNNCSDYNSSMDEFANDPMKANENSVLFYSMGSQTAVTYSHDLSNGIECPRHDRYIEKAYPFSIRQPLLKGVGVFTYFETYDKIAKKIFEEQTSDKEIQKVRKLYKTLYLDTQSSKYMTDCFIIMIIAYYDKFGTRSLYNFALLVDYIIGMVRLNNYYFKDIAIRNFMRSNNVLDIIQLSFEPEEVFHFISSINLKDESKKPENEPINRYADACKRYFGKEYDGDLRDVKLKWALTDNE